MNYFWAFVVGGCICVIGQLLIDLTGLTPARILTGYVVAGVILSAVGWYGPLAEFAGCGATVPLLGFGHLLAKGVRTAIEEEGAIGILTGGLTAAAAGNRRRLLQLLRRQGTPTPLFPQCSQHRARRKDCENHRPDQTFLGGEIPVVRCRPLLADIRTQTIPDAPSYQ